MVNGKQETDAARLGVGGIEPEVVPEDHTARLSRRGVGTSENTLHIRTNIAANLWIKNGGNRCHAEPDRMSRMDTAGTVHRRWQSLNPEARDAHGANDQRADPRRRDFQEMRQSPVAQTTRPALEKQVGRVALDQTVCISVRRNTLACTESIIESRIKRLASRISMPIISPL